MNELLDYFAELAEEAGMDSVAEELRESCQRYVIDQRAGCIAVVDTHHPRYPSGEGGCGMSDLKPCPCGKTPERLIVHAEHSCPKWAWVTGSCCDGWGLEFRNDYAWQDSPEQMEKATEAWNTMERAGDEVAG